jgi:uncharacterized protein
MKIDVSELFRKRVAQKNIDLVLKVEDVINISEEFQINSPVKVEGIVSLTSDILHFDGHIKCDILLHCSRCTEEFAYAIDVDVYEEFTRDNENEDDNFIFIEGDSLDITDIIERNILLALPIKPLCSESCKGLCQSCGADLNINTCNCDNIDVDPRLAQLKDFFTTD